MTYNEIIDVFKKKVQGHFFINEFGYGDISDISTPDDGKAPYYPYIFLNPVSVTSNDRVSTFNFNLICMTQCRDDQYQIIKKQSDCIDNLRDIIAQVNNTLIDPLVEIQSNYTFTPFKERFQDDVVGASCNITVTYPSQLDACNVPIADPDYCLIADTFNKTTAPEFNTTYTFGGWGYFKYTKEEFADVSDDSDEYFEFVCDTRYAWFISTEKKTVSGGDQLYPVMAYIDTGYPNSQADRLSAFYIFTKKDGQSFECGSKSSFYYNNADLNAVSYVNTTSDNGWVIPTEGWIRTFDPDYSQDRTGNVYIFETDCTNPKPSPTAAPLPPPSVTPTPTTSVTPTPSITVTPSASVVPSPSATPTVTPSVTASVTPTITPTSSVTPSITPSVTSTVTPSVTTTPSVTNTPSVTTTPSVTITPSVTTTPSVTITPTITPTATITPTPTPSDSVPAGDPDANAYLADVVASGGTTDATIEAAVQTLFTDLKSAGLYSKLNVMWPFVGGTAASHSINAKLNKSYDITWNGGMTHGVSGSTGNATNGYGITNFSMADFTTKSISSFGLYLTAPQTDSSNQRLHGTFDGGRIGIGTNVGGNGYFAFYSTPYNSTPPTDQTGNFSMVRTGTTEAPVYINENTTPFTTLIGYSPNLPTDPVYLFAYNANDVVLKNSYTNDTMAFCWAGEGLDYSETITLQGIINDFQTSLGRNTY